MHCAKRKRAHPCSRSAANWGSLNRPLLRWKRKFAGLGVAELRRLRQLEEANHQLKQLVAALTRDKHMLQQVLRKKFSRRRRSAP